MSLYFGTSNAVEGSIPFHNKNITKCYTPSTKGHSKE